MYESFGYALAVRVLQSDLYSKLDSKERAECDQLIYNGQAKPLVSKMKQIRGMHQGPCEHCPNASGCDDGCMCGVKQG